MWGVRAGFSFPVWVLADSEGPYGVPLGNYEQLNKSDSLILLYGDSQHKYQVTGCDIRIPIHSLNLKLPLPVKPRITLSLAK